MTTGSPPVILRSIGFVYAREFTSKTFDGYCKGTDVGHHIPIYTPKWSRGNNYNGSSDIGDAHQSLYIRLGWCNIAYNYANSSMTYRHSMYPCVTASDWVQIFCTYAHSSEPFMCQLRCHSAYGRSLKTSEQLSWNWNSNNRPPLNALARRSPYRLIYGCHFDETVFPSLGGDKNTNVQQERQELLWSVPTMSHLDPY